MEGTKMIYDAMDALQMPVENGWTEKLERLEKVIDKLMRERQEQNERIVRLLSTCATWEDKANFYKAESERVKALYAEALEAACEEIEELCNMLSKTREHHGVIEEPCDRFDIDDTYCDNDCGVCLKNYFLTKGQERLDMQKACQDEEEGRKRMDVQDQQKAMKENISLESLDDIVRKAEGLGKELEEKMRRR